MRVVFMGTPEFSVPALSALLDAGHEVAAVYTQPPRPAGRGKKERPSPVHAYALERGIEVRHPTSLKSASEQADFAALNAEVAVVVAYGLLLPSEILESPQYGCLNIHASLLPRWRGAAPIHRAIMAGDKESGVCIMQMDQGLDTGPVLSRRAIPISPTDTTAVLHDRLSKVGADLIVEALASLPTLMTVPQPDEGVTYAAKIDKLEARVDWSRPAKEVDALIRGLSPFPGAWFMLGGERIKVLHSQVATGSGPAGTCLDEQLLVGCGEDAVRLLRLQRAGRGAQDADVFLRGLPIAEGTQLTSEDT